jgi:phosphoribosylamine--glycine ligase
MRFLGIGEDAALTDMYLRLMAAGHEVKVFASSADNLPLRDRIEYVGDWRAELGWLGREDGIALFETAGMGAEQEALRKANYQVVGGSAFGDRLETDREFGQECMRAAGLKTAVTSTFADFRDAVSYVQRRPRRYVFKVNGGGYSSMRSYVGEMEDGNDIIALLNHHEGSWRTDRPASFILMDHVAGVEVGVGGYFNGQDFLDPVVIDWEHKRFFNGDLGELTGEMGTLVSYDNARPLFSATLSRMTEQLRANGYVGYININTVVNDEGIWPLEFTCRFGDPGYAICDALHIDGWDSVLRRMVQRDRLDFAVQPGFAVGVVLTVPPFPYASRYAELSKGQLILFRRILSRDDHRHLHLKEVDFCGDDMLTGGEIGSLMVVTGCGRTVVEARERAYTLAQNVVTPNLRYRTDIGLKFIEKDMALLQSWNLWPKSNPTQS